jgi:hypothetical protein
MCHGMSSGDTWARLDRMAVFATDTARRICAILALLPSSRCGALLPSSWNSSTLTSDIIAGFAGRVFRFTFGKSLIQTLPS